MIYIRGGPDVNPCLVGNAQILNVWLEPVVEVLAELHQDQVLISVCFLHHKLIAVLPSYRSACTAAQEVAGSAVLLSLNIFLFLETAKGVPPPSPPTGRK